MKSPLWKALPTSCPANSANRAGSAVPEITRSIGKSPPPGSGGGVSGMMRTPGICPSLADASICSCAELLSRSLQGLVTMPPKPTVGKHELERGVSFGERLEHALNLLGEHLGLVDGRVGGRLDDGEHHALVLGRRQLTLREHEEREDQRHHHQPQDEHHRTVLERVAEHPSVTPGARSRTGG